MDEKVNNILVGLRTHMTAHMVDTLRAHIEGLEAHNRTMQEAVAAQVAINATVMVQLRAAEARVRDLEVNASRYLYLRDNTSVMIDRGDGWMSGCWLTSHRLDAALDAAREATQK